MFTLRSVQGWLIKLAGGMLAVGIVAGMALAPAYAAGNPPKATPVAKAGQTLTSLYQREQKWLGMQTTALADAVTIGTNMVNWVNTAKSQGKDTSAMEAALTAFQGDVANAESAHDTAAGILATHAGFDSNGQVTDAAQAASTVRQAYQSLQSAHKTLAGAATTLRQVVQNLRKAQS